MRTLLTDSPAAAAEVIRRGGTVAFPTETVYGLGADAFNAAAIRKIFVAKRRPPDNPLIAHVASRDQIDLLTVGIADAGCRLIEAFFPGPLTVVVKKTGRVPSIATAGLDTIGIRMPRIAVAHELLNACRVPLVAPSANLSGSPSPTTWQAVMEDLDGRIDCILRGGSTEIGLESTVVDCTDEVPVVLRKGAISIEQLRETVPEIQESTDSDVERPKSPGLRHRHYSPRARVILVPPGHPVAGCEHAAYIGLTQRPERFRAERVCHSTEEYARSLFEFFRETDRQGIATVYCETVSEAGIGAALMDRLRRAAQTGEA